MEYKIQYKFSVLHWTLRSAEVIEHPYTFTGNTADFISHNSDFISRNPEFSDFISHNCEE